MSHFYFVIDLNKYISRFPCGKPLIFCCVSFSLCSMELYQTNLNWERQRAPCSLIVSTFGGNNPRSFKLALSSCVKAVPLLKRGFWTMYAGFGLKRAGL